MLVSMNSLNQGTEAAFCKEESFKKEAFDRGLPVIGDLPTELRAAHVGGDLSEAAKHLAKSHGLYLQWNRAHTGLEKDWRYMVRVTIPGGGPITAEQYAVLDGIADKYARDPDGGTSLRLTTRQNIQFHWIKLESIVDAVRDIAASGFYTLNGCGDNVRNVIGCPVSTGSELFDSNALARQVGDYFRLDPQAHIQVFAIDPHYVRSEGAVQRFDYGPHLLNRKFKIGIASVRRDSESGALIHDNCVEALTNDIAIAPVVDNGKVERFMVFVGGGQGERNGKESLSTLAQPLGVFTREDLMAGLDAIVKYHRDFGDRENRHLARLKFAVRKDGIDRIREGVRGYGAKFTEPIAGFDVGARHLHHGWFKQPESGLLSFGAFIENGRLKDGGPNGDLKSMVLSALKTFGGRLIITPSQDLLFKDIPEASKDEFEAHLRSFGYGKRNGAPFSNLRMYSLACVGTPTCGLAMADSERFEPTLIDKLETMQGGKYAALCESIGVSGCERQCSRPGTKVIGWIGAGKDLYKLKLGGSEDARSQGELLIEEGGQGFLTRVPKDLVPVVTGALFDYYLEHRLPSESMGYFHQRVGIRAVIDHLKHNPATAELMSKTQEMKLAMPSAWLKGSEIQ